MWWLWGTLFIYSKNVFKCYNIRKTDDATADMKKNWGERKRVSENDETIVEPKKQYIKSEVTNIKNSDQFWNDQREVEKEVEKDRNKE